MEKFYKYPELFKIRKDISEYKNEILILKNKIQLVKNEIQENELTKNEVEVNFKSFKKAELIKYKIKLKKDLNAAKKERKDINKIYEEYKNTVEVNLEISKNKKDDVILKEEKVILNLQNELAELRLKIKEQKNNKLFLEKKFKQEFNKFNPIRQSDKKQIIEKIKQAKLEAKQNIKKIKLEFKEKINLIKKSNFKRKNQKINEEILKRNELISLEKEKTSELLLEKAAIGTSNKVTSFKMIKKAYFWSNSKMIKSKYVNTIKDTMLTVLPFVLFGSLCNLIINVVLDFDEGSFFNFFYFTNNDKVIIEDITNLLNFIRSATIGMLGLVIVFVSSYKFSKYYDCNQLINSILCVIVYIILNNPFISNTYTFGDILSDKGIFAGFLISFVVVQLNDMISKMTFIKKINLNNIAASELKESFRNLVSISIIIFGSIFIAFIFYTCTPFLDKISPHDFPKTNKKNLMEVLSWIIELPIYLICKSNYLLGSILTISSWNILTWFGINASSVLGFLFQDSLLFAINKDHHHWLNNLLNNNFIQCGGAGSTFVFVLALIFFTKRTDFKLVAKLSLIFAIFNINEPLIYCLPVIFNLTFLIPLVLAPVMGLIIVHISIIENLMPIPTNITAWTTPPILGAFISSNGSIGAVVTIILILISQFLVYIPFVLLDNKLYKKFYIKDNEKELSLKDRILKDYDEQFFGELM
ncbi:PTS transporter subunit EIIC [Spiroplasma endosymbiont of Crioceris asparagi]|uniref:PTS transporter subunit EIIC n=1 Tax=Spiroplasma endosymbiont of Crioceris asparagi TaxID=3066286 RepID=UPI0030D6085C